MSDNDPNWNRPPTLAEHAAAVRVLDRLDSHIRRIRAATAKIERDAERVIKLESMLILCRKRFLEYAEHHRAKDPPDVEKAKRNEEIAVVIESVLYPTNADGN